MKSNPKPYIAFLFTALPLQEVLANNVRLSLFDRDPFNISCQYEIYYQYAHVETIIKANALFVSRGFIVFEDYNYLTVRHESKENDSGKAAPEETNKLEVKKYLLHFRSKYKPYPYSIINTNQPDKTVYAPSNSDTLNQINIIEILRTCPKEIEAAENQQSDIDVAENQQSDIEPAENQQSDDVEHVPLSAVKNETGQ